MKVLFIATALFAALAVACKDKADCNKHGFKSPSCVNGKCYDKKCKNNSSSHCPPAHKCIGTVCFPYLAKKGEHCNAHKNCARNLWCSNKKCAAQKPVGSACKADLECDGYPRPMERLSNIYARCQNGRCKTRFGQCSSANDCADGTPCKSVTDNGSLKLCVRGNAVGDKCKASIDCVGSLACYGGRCAEAKYKKIGEPCEESPECRYTCGPDKKCTGEPKGGCLSDDECHNKNRGFPICCDNGSCVKLFRHCNSRWDVFPTGCHSFQTTNVGLSELTVTLLADMPRGRDRAILTHGAPRGHPSVSVASDAVRSHVDSRSSEPPSGDP
ncbi:hypothetical protein GQ42DRAFT_178943 [Ramicandelaber brevisporus]|nr:hypothetical protein GQ42DRAFT_178943 [Ramicandelaber brevisporus]